MSISSAFCYKSYADTSSQYAWSKVVFVNVKLTLQCCLGCKIVNSLCSENVDIKTWTSCSYLSSKWCPKITDVLHLTKDNKLVIRVHNQYICISYMSERTVSTLSSQKPYITFAAAEVMMFEVMVFNFAVSPVSLRGSYSDWHNFYANRHHRLLLTR